MATTGAPVAATEQPQHQQQPMFSFGSFAASSLSNSPTFTAPSSAASATSVFASLKASLPEKKSPSIEPAEAPSLLPIDESFSLSATAQQDGGRSKRLARRMAIPGPGALPKSSIHVPIGAGKTWTDAEQGILTKECRFPAKYEFIMRDMSEPVDFNALEKFILFLQQVRKRQDDAASTSFIPIECGKAPGWRYAMQYSETHMLGWPSGSLDQPIYDGEIPNNEVKAFFYALKTHRAFMPL